MNTEQQASTRQVEYDLVRLVECLKDGWMWVAGLTLVGLVLSTFYLHVATPQYDVTLRVAPAASSKSQGGLSRGMGGLAAIAGLSVGGSGDAVSPFDMFLEEVHSRRLSQALVEDAAIARALFPEHWDSSAKQWREPASISRSAAGLARSTLGFPRQPWAPPSAADVQRYLKRAVIIDRPGRSDPPIVDIRLRIHDPALGRRLLQKIYQIADQRVRTDDLKATRSYRQYLAERVRVETVSEYRQDLASALGQQEKMIMFASSPAPFAARALEPPVSETLPASPNGPFTLAVGLFGGLLLGVSLVICRDQVRRLFA